MGTLDTVLATVTRQHKMVVLLVVGVVVVVTMVTMVAVVHWEKDRPGPWLLLLAPSQLLQESAPLILLSHSPMPRLFAFLELCLQSLGLVMALWLDWRRVVAVLIGSLSLGSAEDFQPWLVQSLKCESNMCCLCDLASY